MKNNSVIKKDLFYILDLFERMKVAYWLDSGWGADALAGKQQGEHRDTDIDFDVQHTQKAIQKLEDIRYRIGADWMPSRMEFRHKEYGYLDIHPVNLSDDGSIIQVNPEGSNYVFQNDWFSEINYKGQKISCVSKEARPFFHSGCNLTEKNHFDIKSLKSIT